MVLAGFVANEEKVGMSVCAHSLVIYPPSSSCGGSMSRSTISDFLFIYLSFFKMSRSFAKTFIVDKYWLKIFLKCWKKG